MVKQQATEGLEAKANCHTLDNQIEDVGFEPPEKIEREEDENI